MNRAALAPVFVLLAVALAPASACIDDDAPRPNIAFDAATIAFDASLPEAAAAPGDKTPPETTLTVTPKAISNQNPAVFEFTSDRATKFACRLDDGAPAECTSPHSVPVTEGTHKFQVSAVTAQNIVDESPATHSWTVDLTPPETTIDKAPALLDNSTTVSFEFSASEQGTFQCTIDGAAPVDCVSPHDVSSLTDGSHTFTVTSIDAAGNKDATPATHTWNVDTSAPDTVINTGPTGIVASTSASFTFSSPNAGAGATYACSLDAAAYTTCTSPKAFTSLAQGAHTFRVRVSDATSNTDPTPAARTWTVDTVPPTVSITAGPNGPTNDSTPQFTFTSSGATATDCRVVPNAFAACTSPHTTAALTDGSYTFEVRARDQANNTATASRAFSVDTAAPTVAITGGPAGPTNDPTPTFTFTSTGATGTQCRIPPAAFANCSSPYTTGTLTNGASYSFEVRSYDAATNYSSVASRSFSIDTTAPLVTSVNAPDTSQATTPITITFTSSGATYHQCRITAYFQAGTQVGAWQPCSSPYSADVQFEYPTLNQLIEVRAFDDAGNFDTGSDTFSTYVVG